MFNRGGRVIDTGTIGIVKVLRQDLMCPNETIKAKVSGKVVMEALRERDTVSVNAHIATFLTPVRWVDSNFVQYLKEGPASAIYPNTVGSDDWSVWGIGGNIFGTYYSMYPEAVVRIFNNYYKWPELPDYNRASLVAHGFRAVNLPHSWTRCLDSLSPVSAANTTVSSVSSFTVQALAEMQARFMTAQKIDTLAHNRYRDIVRELWSAKGSREVDQVPLMIDYAELGLDPRTVTATDGASLGSFASLYDFGIDYEFNVTAPEHCILTQIMLIRFRPITEERNPLAVSGLTWAELLGDHELLAKSPPVQVFASELLDYFTPDYSLGFQPAGWQWRCGWNRIGRDIDVRDSFPVMTPPTNAAQARDGSRRVNAFRSSSLGDYRVDLDFNLLSYSPARDAISSVTAGQQRGGEHPIYPATSKFLR